ncbi:MAG: IPT/TIG domain-containing protein, partial [Verrucomicrobia bacterium]|nr:IPT/TIG domain-containing protein [Verrucomicrobiota bacterium]
MRTVTLKSWVVLCLLPLFAVAAKGETVGIVLTAAGLANSSGTALPDNRLIQLIANTAGQTHGSPTVTSFVSGSDVVLASFALNSSTTGVTGSFQIYLTVDRSAFAGLNSGAPLLLRWYDIPYSVGQTAPGATTYGQFTTSVVVDGATSGWTLDLDGNHASLNFITTSNGGSQSDTLGRATITVLPDAPTVSGVSPASGPSAGGSTVSLTGTNFTGATGVSFGGTAGTSITVNSATSLTVTSPAASAGTVDITVTTSGGTSATSASDRFTFVAAPTIASLSPTSGLPAGGTSVTLTGTNLTGATAVNFGTTTATAYTVDSATSITATSPAGSAGSVNVTVTTVGGTSAGSPFTYIVAPT